MIEMLNVHIIQLDEELSAESCEHIIKMLTGTDAKRVRDPKTIAEIEGIIAQVFGCNCSNIPKQEMN